MKLSSGNGRRLITRLAQAVETNTREGTDEARLAELHARRKLELFVFECLVSEGDATHVVVELKMALHKAKTEITRLRRQLKAKEHG